MSITDRLRCGAEILAILDERREQTGNADLGSGAERFILRRELTELERDIAIEPGELARWISRR